MIESSVRLRDRAYAKALAAGSAVRQCIPVERLPGVDANSPSFRVTRWRAPKKLVDSSQFVKIEPLHPARGNRPASWDDTVIIGAPREQWDGMLAPYHDVDYGLKLAVAYRVGRTALLVGEVPEDSNMGQVPVGAVGTGASSESRVGANVFDEKYPQYIGVALRLGSGVLHAGLGVTDPRSGITKLMPAMDLWVIEPFSQAQLPTRYPGVVLL